MKDLAELQERLATIFEKNAILGFDIQQQYFGAGEEFSIQAIKILADRVSQLQLQIKALRELINSNE